MLCFTEAADFLKVNRVVLTMPAHSGENTTQCMNIEIINDNDIEDEEEFTLILETGDPAVNVTSRLETVIISIDPNDG